MTEEKKTKEMLVQEGIFTAGDYKTFSLTRDAEELLNNECFKMNWLEPSYEKDSKERNLRLEFCYQEKGEVKENARIIALFHMDKYCPQWYQLDSISKFTMVYGLKQKLASDVSSITKKNTKPSEIEKENLIKILEVYTMLSVERVTSKKRKVTGKKTKLEVERAALVKAWNEMPEAVRDGLRETPSFKELIDLGIIE